LSIVTRSPAEFVVIEGNIITDVVGPGRFEKNHLPYIEQGCRILHDSGKLASAHFDDNNRAMTVHIARTSLDIIESFTPPPDCDLGLAEALKAWPDKTVQINFPSSVHLQGAEAVIDTAKKLLAEAAPGIRFIVGVSEDISSGGVDTLVPLAKAVYEYGKTPINI